MRVSLIAGILLVLAGGFVLINGGSFTTQRDVLKLGDLKVSAEEQHPIRPWIAGAAVVAGVVLVAAGARRRA